jgi:hypothetical protein
MNIKDLPKNSYQVINKPLNINDLTSGSYQENNFNTKSPEEPSLGSKIFSGLQTVGNIPGELSKGLTKYVGSASYGMGGLLGGAAAKLTGQEPLKTTKPEILEPKGITQKVGYLGGEIGSFFAPNPLSKISTASKLANLGVKVASEAAKFGGITAVQEGELNKKVATSAGLAAVFPIVGKVFEPTGKYITEKLPERLYSSIFKNTVDDFQKQVRTKAFAKLQEADPETFSKLSQYGFIKNVGGKVKIDETLAKEALKAGMGSSKTGASLEGMAEYSYLKQFELEAKARDIVNKTEQTIDLGNKKGSYLKMLDDLYKNFQETGYGKTGFLQEEANSAKEMYNAIKNTKGSKISADLALKLRRTIDNLRSSSAFRTSSKLGEKQMTFKNAADSIREKLSKVEGLGDIMKEYKTYINFADNLVSEGARRGNTKIVSLFDAIVGGSSMGANVPGTGLGLLAALRTIQTPAVLLFIARSLDKAKGISEPIKNILLPSTNKIINQ